MSDLKRQMQIFVNGAWKDAHHTTANEFPEDCVRFAEPMRPEMPDPKKTVADHSYPAYSREQMVQAMLDAVELYRRTQPEAAPAPEPEFICEITEGTVRINPYGDEPIISGKRTYTVNIPAAQDLSAAILALPLPEIEFTVPSSWESECYARGALAMRKAAAALASSANALSAGDRKDAERLDFIEKNAKRDPKMDGNDVWWPTTFNQRLTGPTLRAAIDRAILQSQKGGK